MKKGTQVAMAIGTGYLLGRRRKMRLAVMLGAGAMASGMGGGIGGQLVKRGTKVLGSADLLGKVSPQLSEISSLVRHDLIDAGRGAARTAVNSRIDSLSDSIRDRADAWRNPAESVRDLVPGRSRAADEEDDGQEEQEAPENGEAELPRRSPGRARSASRRQASSGYDREEDGEEARPARRARPARSAASPVRRTRR